MKRICCFLLMLCLSMSVFVSFSFAAETKENAKIPHVFDSAGLISETEVQNLEESAAQLSCDYSCSVYIVTLSDFAEYSTSIKQCAQDLYEEFNLGWDNGNDNRDLILLLVSLKERDYTIYTNGYKGNEIFNNTGITVLENAVVPYLKNNNWYGAFSSFLNECGSLFRSPMPDDLDAVSPYTVETYGYEQNSERKGIDPFSVLISVLVPSLIAFGVCNGMKKNMNTVVKKTGAEEYITNNGTRMTNRQNILVNRTVQRQIIREPDESHRSDMGFSGGTGGHFSGGPSGHSGKF